MADSGALPRTFDEFRRNAPRREAEADLRHLRALQQAEVAANNLTGSPEWDVFLSYVQHAVKETTEQRDAWQRRLNAPDVVDHTELLKIKIAIAECNARIDAWTVAIALPADIKRNGNKAKDLMARLKPETDAAAV